MANYLETIERLLMNYLQLKERIVGINLIEDLKGYNNCDFGEVKGKLYYCYMVKLASKGRTIKGNWSHFACETAAKVLGLEDYYSDGEGVSGWEAIKVYNSRELSREKYELLKPHSSKIYGVSVAPIGEYDELPDSIIIIANAYQAMRILQGYHYFSSQNKSMAVSGMCGVCFESTALPLKENDLSISMLCSGTRFVCKWSDDAMMISFPSNLLESIVDGIVKTADPCEIDSKKELINQWENFLREGKLVMGNGYFMKNTSDLKTTEKKFVDNKTMEKAIVLIT